MVGWWRCGEDRTTGRCEETGVMGDGGQTTVGILMFDEVEVLDFCGPFEVFSVARALPEEGENGNRVYY